MRDADAFGFMAVTTACSSRQRFSQKVRTTARLGLSARCQTKIYSAGLTSKDPPYLDCLAVAMYSVSLLDNQSCSCLPGTCVCAATEGNNLTLYRHQQHLPAYVVNKVELYKHIDHAPALWQSQ